MNERLIVFTRAPELGQCKKRLASTIGDEAALEAHRDLATALLKRVQAFPGAKEICATHMTAEIERWASDFGFELSLQVQGDLGSRMFAALEKAVFNGAERTVLIGTDCPDIDLRYVLDAFSVLHESELVLGPAEDGGYGLIGLTRPHAELFKGIQWGSDQVVQQTLSQAKQKGLNVGLLREIWDVDTELDWQRYLASSASREIG